MRRQRPVTIIPHYPTTEENKEALAKRVAAIHADAVNARIKDLSCSTVQKLQLLDAVAASAKENALTHK